MYVLDSGSVGLCLWGVASLDDGFSGVLLVGARGSVSDVARGRWDGGRNAMTVRSVGYRIRVDMLVLKPGRRYSTALSLSGPRPCASLVFWDGMVWGGF